MSKLNKLKLSGTTYELQDLSAQPLLSAGTGIQISGNVISCTGGGGGNPTVELTQAEYDALVSAGTVSQNTYYIITDAQEIDTTNYWTSAQTQSAITQATSGKQDALVSGTNIKTINNESLLGSGNITIQGGGKAVTGGTNISVTTGETADTINCTIDNYVTTDTEQIISGKKTFTYTSSGAKAIEFKQTSDSAKVGFSVRNSAATNNEVASFEFRPNTFTIDNVQHPLLYFGHYRNTNTANAGVPQTVIGYRQYDQLNNAAYHYLIPLPEKAKTPFSLTTSFKDYYAPIGFKNGSTMITTDNTGVVDFTSEFSGKADTTAVTQSLAAKQDTLVSGTNIKTINNESLLGSGNITIGGGGTINIDSNLDSGSTNAVANSAITTALSGKVDSSSVVTAVTSASTDSQIPTAKAVFDAIPSGATYSAGTGISITDNVISCTKSETKGLSLDNASKPIKRIEFKLQDVKWGTTYSSAYLNLGDNLVYGAIDVNTLSVSGLVETSAITTSITSASTDSQVPSAKAVFDAIPTTVEVSSAITSGDTNAVAGGAVYDQMGGLKLTKVTQAEYDALVSGGTVDANTLYFITNVVS